MKRLMLSVLFACAAAASGADDPLQTLRKEHPRLFAHDTDIERLRTLIGRDPVARKVRDAIAAEAELILAGPTVQYRLIGPRLLDQSRACLDRVSKLGLLYRLGGDKKYLERALAELRAAAAFPNWNPSHFLDTAEMTTAFAIGYDWFYNDLPAADRDWIRRAIVEKGINEGLKAYDARVWWAKSPWNWNQVCNGGLAIGALALAEDEPEKSRRILREAVGGFPAAMASYAPDGGWAEGPAYWRYATMYNVLFLAALDSALGNDFGLSKSPGFNLAGRFLIYTTSPSGRSFNYADARDGVGIAPEMFWLARKFNEPVYAWYERERLASSKRAGIMDLISYEPQSVSPGEKGWPLDVLFRAVGAAMFRSSWDDPDAIFAGFKAGDNAVNHSHLDLGSFVLDFGRHRWSVDLGSDDYNLPGYFGKERWAIYRLGSQSHSTVLIDGENQNTKAVAPIIASRFDPDFSFVRADLKAAYPAKLARWERGFAMLNRRQILIQDEIEARVPVEALWGMVTDAEVEIERRTAELSKPGWRLQVKLLEPSDAQFDVVSTTPPAPQNPNTGTRKLVVRLPEKIRKAHIVVAFLPFEAGEKAPPLPWRGRPLAEW